jgi:mono/diheme cytochrome c family protein
MENLMNNFKNGIGKIAALGLFPLVLSACGGEPAVSYSQDVKPIIDENCIKCHQAGGKGELASGFNMSTYDSLMKGARFGPMVIAGDAEGSNMVVLMEGRADPSISMPHGQQKSIPKEDIQTIRAWIKQGAKNN